MNEQQTPKQVVPEHEGIFGKIKNRILGHRAVATAAGVAVVAGAIGGGVAVANSGENHDSNAGHSSAAEKPVAVLETPSAAATETPNIESTPTVRPSALPEAKPTSVAVSTQEAQPTPASTVEVPQPAVTPTQEAQPTPTPTPEDAGLHGFAGEGDSWEGIDQEVQQTYYPSLDQATIKQAIEQANPDKNPEDLYKWGEFNIPEDIDVKVKTDAQVLPAPPADAPYIYGSAGEGDSWNGIEQEFYPTVSVPVVEKAIETINPDKNPNELYKWGKFEVPKDIDVKAQTPETK